MFLPECFFQLVLTVGETFGDIVGGNSVRRFFVRKTGFQICELLICGFRLYALRCFCPFLFGLNTDCGDVNGELLRRFAYAEILPSLFCTVLEQLAFCQGVSGVSDLV